MEHTEWYKSSYSGADGACLEVADLPNEHRAVRDSKDPAGSVLIFTAAQWSVFVSKVGASK